MSNYTNNYQVPYQIPYGSGQTAAQDDSWAPDDLTGISGWYAVGDIGDFYQDHTQTTAVTAEGDPVGTWINKSGGSHFTQATAGLRPTYQGSYIDSDADYLQGPNLSLNQQLLIGVSATVRQLGAWSAIFSHGATAFTANPGLFIGADTTAGRIKVYIEGGNNFALTGLSLGDRVTTIIRITYSNPNYLVDCWFNGSKQSQRNAGTGLSNGTSSPTWLTAGYPNAGTHDLYGYVLATGSAYSDEDATELNTYLEAL